LALGKKVTKTKNIAAGFLHEKTAKIAIGDSVLQIAMWLWRRLANCIVGCIEGLQQRMVLKALQQIWRWNTNRHEVSFNKLMIEKLLPKQFAVEAVFSFRHQSVLSLKQDLSMLYTLALILIIAWLLGLVSSYTMGGFIHVLLVLAVVMILVRLIQGRKL
jgi:hypothetical protein